MAITAKELAQMLDLSEAAVSFALNNRPGVGTETRKKVIEAAKRLGYDFTKIREKENPSSMKGSIYFIIYKSHGAVVTDTPFFSQLSEGIEACCKQLHYFMSISYIYGDDHVDAHLKELEAVGCRGIILLGTEMQPQDLLPFKDTAIPLVLLDSYFENENINCVLINNIHGAYEATCRLIRKCKSQPGYLHSSYSIQNFEERADGFYKAIRSSGMSTSKSIVHRLAPSAEGAYADMLELLQQGEQPARCYFADNDLIAIGAMKAFKEKGYRIPQDIAIIGFDDMPYCNYSEPPLSTVRVPKQYMGTVAVRRLAQLIEGEKEEAVKIEIGTTLIKRGSCL